MIGMNDYASQSGLDASNVSGQEPSSRDTVTRHGTQTTREPQSVEDLMQLRTQIDRELNKRLTQDLCLMLSDVVGSTTFYQKFGDVEGRLFVQRHHDTLAPLVTRHGGKVIKTIGDAVMASFEKPLQAIDCAIAMQQQLWDINQQSADDTPLRAKVSLHYGSALVEANDVFGDLVNMSARLNGLVEPDQILISHEVYAQVKEQITVPVLPLEPIRWKDGEKGLVVYEVLWQQQGSTDDPLVFRHFGGAHHACFYCGLREHPVGHCPSKQLDRYVGRLDRLGYLPLPKILQLFQQEDLSIAASSGQPDAHVFEAFYEISLPYQLRFLVKIWLATSQEWREVERQQIGASPMAGTRLWMGFDCLRVGRLDEARRYLLAALESNAGDYKPYVALGLWAMEQGDPVAVLQYWRKGLALVSNNLQAAYLHVLMSRFYEVSGKADLAKQQLQKALSRDAYLHEAKYRRIALAAKEEKSDNILAQLHKLIQDDRVVFLKVLLDPAFAPLQANIVPLLSTLLREARAAAMEQMVAVMEELNALRPWYPQPEADLISIERVVESMRQHIKSGSYFGYRDAAHEGELLRHRIQKHLAHRQAHLRREFSATLNAIQQTLQPPATSPRLSSLAQQGHRTGHYQQELARLQRLRDVHTANRFWRAWKDLQVLKTAVEHLDPSMRKRRIRQQNQGNTLRSMVLFGLSAGVVVDTAVFGILGYLMYFSGLRLSEQRLLVFLTCGALGGCLMGTALGWAVNWYRTRR